MKKILSGALFLTALFLIINIIGCSKDPDSQASSVVPYVTTLNVIAEVTNTTAKSGGIVTNPGSSAVLTFGVCWSSTNQNPTIADSKTVDAATTLVYPSSLTGLTAGTTYYVRAYATNNEGTGYGSVIKF